MKVLLNLLPQEKRDALERRMRSRFFAWLVFLGFTLEVFYTVVLVGVLMLLSVERKNQALAAEQLERYRAEERRLSEIEEVFREANRLSDNYIKVERAHMVFSNIFVLLERHGGDAIALDRVSTKDYQISIAGVAKTRDELIAFNDRLKGDRCFAEVILPRPNLFAQENADFQIEATLKPECLKEGSL
jgi:Tfp pilus assembly protein PilN